MYKKIYLRSNIEPTFNDYNAKIKLQEKNNILNNNLSKYNSSKIRL